jgi:hypothetical protein
MIAMNTELSSKFTLSDHKTVTIFVKCFKVGSKMVIAASAAPMLLNQKKQCCKIARFIDALCISAILNEIYTTIPLIQKLILWKS